MIGDGGRFVGRLDEPGLVGRLGSGGKDGCATGKE